MPPRSCQPWDCHAITPHGDGDRHSTLWAKQKEALSRSSTGKDMLTAKCRKHASKER